MSNDTCKFLENGHCTKLRRNGKCRPSKRDWLESVRQNEGRFIGVDRICENESPFGNYYIGLTSEDIERIKNGEVLCFCDEYGFFIGLQNES